MFKLSLRNFGHIDELKKKDLPYGIIIILIAGVLAISDCNGRTAKAEKVSLKKHFGFYKWDDWYFRFERRI